MLDNTGPNGFLSVVAALGWWGSVRKDDSWVAAIADVRWVLNALVQSSKRQLEENAMENTNTLNQAPKKQCKV